MILLYRFSSNVKKNLQKKLVVSKKVLIFAVEKINLK